MDKVSKYLAFLVLFTVSSIAIGFDGDSVAEELRKRFLESKFQRVGIQSDLPDILVNNFSGYGPDDIADIGEAYNATDFIEGSLPSRQIVLAGISETVSYVVLNQGGIATYQFTILVGRVSEAVVLCRYYFHSMPDDDVVELRHWFEKGEFLTEPECVVAA